MHGIHLIFFKFLESLECQDFFLALSLISVAGLHRIRLRANVVPAGLFLVLCHGKILQKNPSTSFAVTPHQKNTSKTKDFERQACRFGKKGRSFPI
ncbi:hypothetical protein RUMCAL_01285 [Ruminococcus callidus ATCC 27760]|uniref:Uncharacterized protein n=1 Tax=Ruminococcus callidus ATCC 27760 TaxID=411473 RepID=U2M3N0_9FIRM|nr:hypothetical protein RUMCAL_01285 [Ruminococcus callidus ATCC 27760]